MSTNFKANMTIIEHALDSVDEPTFNELINGVVTSLKAGNKVVVSGLGKNVPICDKFTGSMLSAGLSADFLHTNTAIHGDLGMVHEGDIVIILTKSGSTRESVDLVEALRQKFNDDFIDNNVWLLTFNANGTLSKTIKHVLLVSMEHEGDPWNIMPNNSTIVNLIVLQELVMEVIKKMGVTLEQFSKNHPGGAIGKAVGTSVDN